MKLFLFRWQYKSMEISMFGERRASGIRVWSEGQRRHRYAVPFNNRCSDDISSGLSRNASRIDGAYARSSA